MSMPIAVIHARGGSVRVPLKNLRLLGGHPLIAWTIRAALMSSCSRVIVSTDHPEIAQVSKKYGAEVPFMRPEHLSSDVPSELVTQHALLFHDSQSSDISSHCITIQPTTPFITPEDIDQSLSLFNSSPLVDSVFSASPVVQRPEWMFYVDQNLQASNFTCGSITGNKGVSQELPPLWHPNGGIYVTRRDVLFDLSRLIGEKPSVHSMSLERSVDIDEEFDFIIAEGVISHSNFSIF